MKTREEIIKLYNDLTNEGRSNMNKLNNGEITEKEWVSMYDSLQKRWSGWRRSAISHLASICEVEYKEMSLSCAKLDNVDLAFKHNLH